MQSIWLWVFKGFDLIFIPHRVTSFRPVNGDRHLTPSRPDGTPECAVRFSNLAQTSLRRTSWTTTSLTG
nr:hypothetical protein SHINE37_41401 [Rhizobiaceae bacterium]